MATIQVAVDCARPHVLVKFWAEVLHLEIEDHSEQIRGLLDSGVATSADTTEVDGRLAWATAAACNDPTGALPRMLFQQVPEPKTVKNRWHLDVHVAPDQRDAEVERLVALGATHLWDGQQGPYSWVTLADPEGNEFCVS
jgi:hypothetical protein